MIRLDQALDDLRAHLIDQAAHHPNPPTPIDRVTAILTAPRASEPRGFLMHERTERKPS